MFHFWLIFDCLLQSRNQPLLNLIFIEIFERISGTEREGYFVSVFKWEINDPCESNSASCDKKA
jgi:hypothetical protein